MSDTNRLTIEEVEAQASLQREGFANLPLVNVYQQLADVMRENELLREALMRKPDTIYVEISNKDSNTHD